MSTETPNLLLQYIDPSQSQPEVKINDAWDKIDAFAAGGGGGASLTVEDLTQSPPITITNVATLRFDGVTVTEITGGVALVTASGGGGAAAAIVIQLAASDLATALATATGVAYLRSAQAFTIDSVRSSLQTVSSSGLVTVDIKKNGTTILSTALSIDATEKTSTTAATPAVVSVTSMADDDEISIDITAAGTGAKGLIVTIKAH